MANKKIKVYYFYATRKEEEKIKVIDLKETLEGLQNLGPEERILSNGDEGNIQLKKIEYDESSKRWNLAFLKNQSDAPFKTKLSDCTESAEPLDEDEYIGQECCVIYDEESKILSMQNNRGSVSCRGISQFLIKFMGESVILSALTYEEKYCSIADDDEDMINYKSLIINYTEISELAELAKTNDDEALVAIANLSKDLSALSGKIELSVGRSKNLLDKSVLRKVVNFFKKNPKCTTGLKVKMVDHDTIRVIDLLSNKVDCDISISVTKDDPKTFTKIFNAMDAAFDTVLEDTLDKCKILSGCI